MYGGGGARQARRDSPGRQRLPVHGEEFALEAEHQTQIAGLGDVLVVDQPVAPEIRAASPQLVKVFKRVPAVLELYFARVLAGMQERCRGPLSGERAVPRSAPGERHCQSTYNPEA